MCIDIPNEMCVLLCYSKISLPSSFRSRSPRSRDRDRDRSRSSRRGGLRAGLRSRDDRPPAFGGRLTRMKAGVEGACNKGVNEG